MSARETEPSPALSLGLRPVWGAPQGPPRANSASRGRPEAGGRAAGAPGERSLPVGPGPIQGLPLPGLLSPDSGCPWAPPEPLPHTSPLLGPGPSPRKQSPVIPASGCGKERTPQNQAVDGALGGQEAAWVLTMGVSALARLHSEGPPLLVNLGPSQVWLLVRGQRLLPRAPPQALVRPLAAGSLGGSSVKGAQLLSPVRGGQSAPSVLPGLPGPEHWVPAHPMRWWEWPQAGGALRGQARPLPTPTLCR